MATQQAAVMMPIVLKATCSLFQSQREVEAAIYDVVLVPSALQIIKNVKEETTQWSKEVKEKGKGHDAGHPHLRVWGALRDSLLVEDVGRITSRTLSSTSSWRRTPCASTG